MVHFGPFRPVLKKGGQTVNRRPFGVKPAQIALSRCAASDNACYAMGGNALCCVAIYQSYLRIPQIDEFKGDPASFPRSIKAKLHYTFSLATTMNVPYIQIAHPPGLCRKACSLRRVFSLSSRAIGHEVHKAAIKFRRPSTTAARPRNGRGQSGGSRATESRQLLPSERLLVSISESSD